MSCSHSAQLRSGRFIRSIWRGLEDPTDEHRPHARYGRRAVRPYSHAVEVPEGSRLLYISGEVGVLADGTVPEGTEAQAEASLRNIIAILADAGMGVSDLVKITTYLVRPEDVAAAGAARAKNFGDARPGSATIIVKALVAPEWLIEIEAVAAVKA
jgi:2-iminobutanoate/2-iminopropanoate deaminase